jgi:phage I-like protein
VLLTSVGEGNDPPTEFRLFRRGINSSDKGDFIFDDAAANAVMATYAKHGVELHIDLEHLSLDPSARNYDPDARGSAALEVRNGELWAVNVRWAPDGEQRLREKRQRYISPAFLTDKDNRVTRVINVALTGMPATDYAPALIAANQVTRLSQHMDPEVVKQALEALKSGDGAAAITVLEALLTAAASGDAGAASSSSDPTGDGSTAGNTPGGSDLGGDPQAAALSALGLTKEQFEQMQSAVATLSQTEAEERKTLVGKLVKLGAETPATAWKDGAPCARLTAEPIADLRLRVVELSKAKPAARAHVTPPNGAGAGAASPEGSSGSVVKLNAAEIAHCKKFNMTEAEFVAKKNAAVRRG